MRVHGSSYDLGFIMLGIEFEGLGYRVWGL